MYADSDWGCCGCSGIWTITAAEWNSEWPALILLVVKHYGMPFVVCKVSI